VTSVTVPGATKAPPDLFVVGAALQQRQLAPNLLGESAAFCKVSEVLADDPSLAVRQLLETARSLCEADSAGLSLLHTIKQAGLSCAGRPSAARSPATKGLTRREIAVHVACAWRRATRFSYQDRSAHSTA
jgi:hypothetical protein